MRLDRRALLTGLAASPLAGCMSMPRMAMPNLSMPSMPSMQACQLLDMLLRYRVLLWVAVMSRY